MNIKPDGRRMAGLISAWMAGLCALAPLAQAHDVILVPQGHELRVRYGHPQDWLPIDAERLLELQVLAGDAPMRDVHELLHRKGDDLVAPRARLAAAGVPWLAAARYDNGLWVERPAVDGGKPQWRNTSRALVPEATSVMWSVKFAKAYAGDAADGAGWGRVIGHPVELVPQRNPLAVKAGETLPVLVLFNGKPLAGVGVEAGNLVDKLPEDKIARYITAADGIAQVPLRAHGIHALGVDIERARDDSPLPAAATLPADKVLLIATYTFVR